MTGADNQELARSQRLTLLFLIGVGIALRLMRIGRSYWFDELYTMAQVVEPSFQGLLRITTHDANNPPLFSILNYGWTGIFGYSEIGARSLSLLFGIALIGTPWIAKTALGQSEKWLVATLLALWYLPIRFSQEVRVYSLMVLLAGICLFSYLETCAAPRRAVRVTLLVSLFLLASTHVFGILLAVSMTATFALYAKDSKARVLWVLYTAILAAVGAGPLLLEGILEQAGGRFWIPFTPSWLLIQALLVVTPIGGGLLLYGFGVAGAARPRIKLDPQVRRALLPFLVMLLASFILSIDTPIIIARNLICLVPALALIVGVWLRGTMHRRRAPVVALLGAMAVQSAALEYFWISFSREDFRSVAQMSLQSNTPVCYVVSDTEASRLQRLYGFYVDQMWHRHDLKPRLLEKRDFASESTTRQCSLWAAIHAPGFEFRQEPIFEHCRSHPTGNGSPLNVVMECAQ